MSAGLEVLLAGGGAVGSRLAVRLPPSIALTAADADLVLPENLGVSAFEDADLFQHKAAVLAARRRAVGGVGRGLVGDVRYALRPGLAAAIDVAVLALDNPRAIRDAAEALWAGGRPGLLVLALTCGGDHGYLARHFTVPGTCPVCLFGSEERRADRRADGAGCAATSAPRASAGAASAAAAAGAELLARWLAGDRSLAGRRVQRDGAAGPPFVARLPESPGPRCPVPHAPPAEREDLARVAAVTVGELAERALAVAGDDAELLLGRRAVPLGGMYCRRCGSTWPATPLLMPAAQAARPCACAETARPLGERTAVGARELLARDVASLTLEAWGAGHGDEFQVRGAKGTLRLRCSFAWEDLDG